MPYYLLLSIMICYYVLLAPVLCYYWLLSAIIMEKTNMPHTKRTMSTHLPLQENAEMTKWRMSHLFIKLLTGNLRANVRATTQHELHSRSSGTSESQHVRACGGYAFRQFQTIPDHFEEANKKNINNSEFESFTPIPLRAWLGTKVSTCIKG